MKKRIQTIHNKVLVDGPVGDLREHEILVSSEENKVFLQELINGNLETVSEGHVTNLEKLMDDCLTWKKLANSATSAGTVTFNVGTGIACICEVSSSTEEKVSIKKYTGSTLAVSVPASSTIYIAFNEVVSSGTGPATISQDSISKDTFLSKIEFFV